MTRTFVLMFGNGNQAADLLMIASPAIEAMVPGISWSASISTSVAPRPVVLTSSPVVGSATCIELAAFLIVLQGTFGFRIHVGVSS